MTIENIRRESAKIYSFPLSPRISRNRFEQELNSIPELKTRRGPAIMASSGWYHEAAQEDERKLKS